MIAADDNAAAGGGVGGGVGVGVARDGLPTEEECRCRMLLLLL